MSFSVRKMFRNLKRVISMRNASYFIDNKAYGVKSIEAVKDETNSLEQSTEPKCKNSTLDYARFCKAMS